MASRQEGPMAKELPEEAQTFLVKLVTNPISTFLIRNISARLDPLLMKATNGK